jgi:hypothetical protein
MAIKNKPPEDVIPSPPPEDVIPSPPPEEEKKPKIKTISKSKGSFVDFGKNILQKSEEGLRDFGKSTVEDIKGTISHPIKRIERAALTGTTSLLDIIPLAVNLTNRGLGGAKELLTNSKDKEGGIMPPPLIGKDIPYLTDVVFSSDKGILKKQEGAGDLVAQLLGPQVIASTGKKASLTVSKLLSSFYETSSVAKEKDVSQRVEVIGNILEQEKQKSSLIQARNSEKRAKESMGIREYTTNTDNKIKDIEESIKNKELDAQQKITKQLDMLESKTAESKDILEAKKIIQNSKFKENISNSVEQIGDYLKSKYDKIINSKEMKDINVPNVGEDISNMLTELGEDVKGNSKSNVVNSLKNIIRDSEIIDGETAENAATISEKKVGQVIENVESNEFNVPEAHKIKQILQEYARHLNSKSYSKGNSIEVTKTVNSLIDNITNAIEKKLPETDSINYKQLGKDYSKYIELKDRGKALYGEEKFKGSKFIEDITKTHYKLKKLSKYANEEELTKAIAENSSAYTQYLNVVNDLKKFGYNEQAAKLEDSLFNSVKDMTDINILDDFIKKNKPNLSIENIEDIEGLKKEINILKQKKSEYIENKEVRLEKQRLKDIERSVAQKELEIQGKSAIKDLLKGMPENRKARMFHLLATGSYLSAPMPTGPLKATTKILFALYALQDVVPHGANALSRLLSKTNYLLKAKKLSVPVQTYRQIEGVMNYLNK